MISIGQKYMSLKTNLFVAPAAIIRLKSLCQTTYIRPITIDDQLPSMHSCNGREDISSVLC